MMELQERVLPLMTVTESRGCQDQAADRRGGATSSVLRVAIQGGGCSGFQYGLGFDRGAAEGDLEFEMHGVQVVVDPFSAPYLKGAEIDYVDSIQAAGFAINNPNASSSCGCGHSFQVEEGAEAEGAVGGCGSRLLRLTALASRVVSGPLRVAVVGSGPAGLLRRRCAARRGRRRSEVDMIERLPTPLGPRAPRRRARTIRS